MRISRPDPYTLAGAYALDALTGADLARFERHLARCEHCAREVSGLREATARLAAAVAADPPAGLTQRALAAAALTRQLPPVTRGATAARSARHAAATRSVCRAGGGRAIGRRQRAWVPRLALAVAAASMVTAAILAVAAHGAAHQLEADQQRGQVIAAVLTAPDATMLSARVTTGGTAAIVMSSRERALVFTAAGLRPLPSSRCYQLWLMGPGGDRPAGMLPEPRQGMTGPVIASGLRPGDRLGLTVESSTGSPRPTSAMILMLAL